MPRSLFDLGTLSMTISKGGSSTTSFGFETAFSNKSAATITHTITAIAVDVALRKCGVESKFLIRRLSAYIRDERNVVGFRLNSIQFRLSSSCRNANWIASRSIRSPVSMIVGWYSFITNLVVLQAHF